MGDRKLTVEEVNDSLDDGILNLNIYWIDTNGAHKILEHPQISYDPREHSINFKTTDNEIERYMGQDTEDTEDGEEVFKDIFVTEEQPHVLPQQGGRRRKTSRKGRKTSRKGRKTSRKGRKSRRKSRRY